MQKYIMSLIILHGVQNNYAMDNMCDFAMQQIIIPKADHTIQRILATVNKAYNKTIEDTYRPDKKRIELLMLQQDTHVIPEHIWWNNNFSRCAWITIEPTPSISDEKKLELTLMRLDAKKDLVIRTGTFNEYKAPVINDHIRPVFDKKMGIFCYGVGNGKNISGITEQTVNEYSLNFNGMMQYKQCYIYCNIKNGSSRLFNCNILLNFPTLLKALLQSKQTREQTFARNNIDQIPTHKFYYICSAIIPKDYQICKVNELSPSSCLSYDELPERLRDAIKDQYNKQHSVK